MVVRGHSDQPRSGTHYRMNSSNINSFSLQSRYVHRNSKQLATP